MTILNVSFASDDLPAPKQIFGDARSLDFPDKSFDVVYSNSVIEHVGNSLDQREMANHIRRVGKRHFVQTPNYYFPIEPHFLFPGFQFLPTSARAHLLNRFDLGWMAREPTLDVARDVVDSVRLLKRSEFVRLFPDSHIYDETFCGLTKSFIAYDGF